jgi:isoleucyl-tRNA synthetase
VIFRNTPQWFVHMDRDIGDATTLRQRALEAVDDTRFVPATGQNRLRAMIEGRPDWVLSRQRAWGVPITVFVDRDTGELLRSAEVNSASSTLSRGGRRRLVRGRRQGALPRQFASSADGEGRRHPRRLVRFRLDALPSCWRTARPEMAGRLYLEGSDQHRGWFHSSLLESCGTRGRAPYDAVLTHGFVIDEDGRKMSKSLGNPVAPQQVIEQSAPTSCGSGSSSDYCRGPADRPGDPEDERRFLPQAAQHDPLDARFARAFPPPAPRERIGDAGTRAADAVGARAARRVGARGLQIVRLQAHLFRALLFHDERLSAFYFDIRKDRLYCDPASSKARHAALTVIDRLFRLLIRWLAPMIPFTCEEAWAERHRGEGSVHLQLFAVIPRTGARQKLEAKWEKVHRSAGWFSARWKRREWQSGSAPRSRRKPSSLSPIPTFTWAGGP